MNLTEEDRLLLLSCRNETDQNIKEKIDNATKRRIDWTSFLEKARENDVSAMVYLKLIKSEISLSNIPSNILDELKKDYYCSAVNNTLIFKELEKVLRVLKKEGLRVIVLKGAALAEIVYDNITSRPMADVDLLIRNEDFLEIDKMFEVLGYIPVNFPTDQFTLSSQYLTALMYQHQSSNFPSFHIHWHFINSSVPNESYIKNVNIKKIWQNAEEVEIANVQTLGMAPHHLLIHLSEHALRVTHSFSRYSYFCDIDRVINFYKNNLDWERLNRDSFNFKLDRMVFLSLYFTSVFLNTKVPKDVLLRLKPKRFYLAERIFMYLISRNIRLSGLSYLVHFSQNRGLLKKMKFVGRTLFPPRLIMAQRNFVPLQEVKSRHYIHRIKGVFGIFVRLLKHYIS